MPRNRRMELEQITVNIKRTKNSLDGQLLAYLKQLDNIALTEAVMTGLKTCYLGDLIVFQQEIDGKLELSAKAKKEIIATICNLEGLAMQLRMMFDLSKPGRGGETANTPTPLIAPEAEQDFSSVASKKRVILT